MATTPNLNLPLVEPTATADVPRDLNALAQAVDAALGAGPADTNATVKQQVALLLESDTRETVLEWTGGVLTGVVEKDGATEVSRTTLNYTAGALSSVVEAAGGKTVTSTLVRDGGGILTGITKGVV